MFLLILESLGTQELILIGIVALIVFGPRRLPEMARKAGGMIKELRGVSNEFRSTWAEEVKLEEVKEALSVGNIENLTNKILDDPGVEVSKVGGSGKEEMIPEIKEISTDFFKDAASKQPAKTGEKIEPTNTDTDSTENDKNNWL